MKPVDGHSCEQVELYALGCLSPEEAAAYESHLLFCETCRKDMEEHARTVEDLSLVAPVAAPPSGLRDRVMQRLATVEPALRRAADALWEATGFDGVDIRRLFVDTDSEIQTIIVKMRPGSTYPMHVHGGKEECYVIEGDLFDGTVRMGAGDYVCYRGGTSHGPLSTRTGCLLLVQSSLHNEFHDHA